MAPARLERPWGVLKFDIHDMEVSSDPSHKVPLVEVDKASNIVFTFPLPTKQALGLARKLLLVMLPFDL